MHEWALAESIVDSVSEILREKSVKGRIKVYVVIGELQTIELDILKFAIEEIKKESLFPDAEYIYIEEKAVFKCNNCGWEWKLDDIRERINDEAMESIHFIPELSHTFISCPKCGSNDFTIISGRGIYIKSIEVE